MICEKKTECCGCTACKNACPAHCIEMKEDFEGFQYPEVDKTKCLNCGLCEKVCPVLNPPRQYSEEIQAYAVRTTLEDVLRSSTSGGFVTPLADWVLNQGGVLCAATYLQDFSVAHIIIDKDKMDLELPRIRGSKYVQSDLKRCYLDIKQYLEQEKKVCFVGTTCQVNGLKSFLRREYDSLITVDLVCHGTPSPKLWRKYLDEKQIQYGAKVVGAAFRNKTYGYHSHTMRLSFENGKEYYGSGRIDAMMKSFMSEIASRPICYQCPFKTYHRCSDFTVFDCWHADVIIQNLKDDDKGFTNLLIHSEKGRLIFEEIKDRYISYPVNVEDAIKYDGKMVLKSATPHARRGEFFVGMDQEPLADHIQNFIPIKVSDHLIEKMKSLLYKLGILKLINKK